MYTTREAYCVNGGKAARILNPKLWGDWSDLGFSSLVTLNIRLSEPQMWPGWGDEKKLSCYRQKLQSLHSPSFILLRWNYTCTFPKVMDYTLWSTDTQARLHSIAFANFYVVYIYIYIYIYKLMAYNLNGTEPEIHERPMSYMSLWFVI